MIDGEMRRGIVFVGVLVAIVTLAALDLGLHGGSGTIDEARTMAFTTLVIVQLFNCLNARSDRESAFHGLFANRWLWAQELFKLVVRAGGRARSSRPVTAHRR